MSRFSNLEFRGQNDAESREGAALQEPRDERFYMRRAEEMFRAASFEKALRYYSRTLEFNPNQVEGWIGQARMLVELGELNEALMWSDKALEIFRNDPGLLAVKAVANARLGRRLKALECSDAALQAKGTSSFVWLARGEVLLGRVLGKHRFCFQQAIALSSGDWFIRLQVARIYFFYRRFSNALQYAREAFELKADAPFVWLVLGNCQLEFGQWRQARRSFSEALSLDPQFEAAKVALHTMRHDVFGWLFSPLRRLWR